MIRRRPGQDAFTGMPELQQPREQTDYNPLAHTSRVDGMRNRVTSFYTKRDKQLEHAQQMADQKQRQAVLDQTGAKQDIQNLQADLRAVDQEYVPQVNDSRAKEEHLAYLQPRKKDWYADYAKEYGNFASSKDLEAQRQQKRQSVYDTYSKAINRLKQYGWKF